MQSAAERELEDTHGNRRSSRIPAGLNDVVIYDSLGGMQRGQTLDEAFGGLGLLVDGSPDVYTGQEADVFYNGLRMTAIVRHIGSLEDSQFRLGLAWKGAVLAQRARAALQTRKEHGLASDDQQFESFIRSVPGAAYTMWSLYEANNWCELAESAQRIGKVARLADVGELTPLVDRLRRAIADCEPYEHVGAALQELIEAAIEFCQSLD